jgi:branched-chain amino acid transport system substrate-binding protein
MMKYLPIKLIALSIATFGGIAAAISGLAAPQPREQFIPMLTFKVGQAGQLGLLTTAGYEDYWQMLNKRDGGIGGVKLVWEECETERDLKKGIDCYEKLKNKGPTGASVVNPIATDIAYALLKRLPIDKIPMMTGGFGVTASSDGSVFPYVFPVGTNYWSMNTAKIKYIGLRLGGMDKLAGKTIVNLYHGSGYGKETMEILNLQSQKYGFRVVHIEVPLPGTDQDAQWKQIVELKPAWVILRGIGGMNPVALTTAHKYGWPASRILGVTWSGAEEDVLPAGAAAKGYISAAVSLSGKDFPALQDIMKYVYANGGQGGLPDSNRVGSTYYNRGVSGAIYVTEAIRAAQGRFGKRPLTGEEIRWGFENMQINERRIAEIGGFGLVQPLKLSCANHEGGGSIRFQRWSGKEWVPITGWIEGDQSLVRPLIEKSAAEYAQKEGIVPRNCAKEGGRRS